MRTLAILLLAAACGGKVPETRYYQLAVKPASTAPGGDLVLALDSLVTDAAYDDERIVYRANPYRLDYYQYHRWSASPGVMIGNFLEQSLEKSGAFRAVVREVRADAPVVLGGRIVAIEEVDAAPNRWLGRIVIELVLTDAATGRTLWTEQFEETEPLAKQTPEGLAQALSSAMARIAARATPEITRVAATAKLEPGLTQR